MDPQAGASGMDVVGQRSIPPVLGLREKSWCWGSRLTGATAKYGSEIVAKSRGIRVRSTGDADPDLFEIWVLLEDLSDGPAESSLEGSAFQDPLDRYTRRCFQICRHANGHVEFIECHIRAHGSSLLRRYRR